MKSIFDGWERKIELRQSDGDGGFCAVGWIVNQRLNAEAKKALWRRLGGWIKDNLDPPSVYRHPLDGLYSWGKPQHLVIWANNECKLDIEGFKMVDLLTQGYVPEEVHETEAQETCV